MAADPARLYEADKFFAGEPAVHQQVVEPYAFVYGAPYHFYQVVRLFPEVLVMACLVGVPGAARLLALRLALFVRKAVLPILAWLPMQGEVLRKETLAVMVAEHQRLVSVVVSVGNMRENPAHKLDDLAAFRKVRIVSYQTPHGTLFRTAPAHRPADNTPCQVYTAANASRCTDCSATRRTCPCFHAGTGWKAWNRHNG